jgi:hypothetical protein
LQTLFRRSFAALAFCLTAAGLAAAGLSVPAGAATVSLMNGSELSMTGLNLTVSNCVLVIAGWQQTSCAQGSLVLQTVSGGQGGSTYQLAWNSAGTYGLSNGNQVGGSGMYELSFSLAVAATQPGSHVTATTLTALNAGAANCGSQQCSGDLNVSQAYSAAAGGGQLTADLQTSAIVSSTLTNTSEFMLNETVTIDAAYLNQMMDGYNPDTPDLALVSQKLAPASEPTTIALLLTGVGGLLFARSCSRCT